MTLNLLSCAIFLLLSSQVPIRYRSVEHLILQHTKPWACWDCTVYTGQEVAH